MIVTVTVSTLVLVPSVTDTWNTAVELLTPSGAVNVGCDALVLLNVTLVPLVCVQV